jgi:hypothetical protein
MAISMDLLLLLVLRCLSVAVRLADSNDLPPQTIADRTITFQSRDFTKLNLTIISCIFTFCEEAQHSHRGGAIEVLYSYVYILNSLFDTCSTHTGGAAAFTDSTVVLVGTNFTLNLADEAGAAAFDLCHVGVSGGFSWYNEALEVGAFEFISCDGWVDRHVLFYNMAHQGETGGIHLHSSPIQFRGCTFCHNHVEAGWAGAISLDQINGTVEFEKCDFVSNEVVGSRDIHIFLCGKATVLVLKECNFDNPDEKETILEMLDDGQRPVISKIGTKFGAKIDHPFAGLIGNDSVEWTYAFSHHNSDVFAVLMFILVPAFIGAVTWCLTW